MSSKQWSLGELTSIDQIEPKYDNLKIEVLTNEFAQISKTQWNDTLKKSKFIYQNQNFKYILQLKEIIALKLYCDFDALQCEYKKCFRSPYNQNKLRLQSFYHWNKILSSTIKKLSNPQLKLYKSKLQFDHKKWKSVYHGVSSIMDIKLSSDNTWKYYGPLSTTTDIFIARSFAGSNGMIIEIQFPIYQGRQQGNNQIPSKPIDITYFSAFPEEQEILCFDQLIYVKSVITSSEFDAQYLGSA